MKRFVYDFLGNRSPDDGARPGAINENNQLTGTGTYDYDDHGNMAVKRGEPVRLTSAIPLITGSPF
ncbi:MAG: hypothetical protein JKP90_06705 [Desulfofustis sp. PB-SRB1]|nr:hypothetical protein [Desulfofustis sp. PB-SRB1]